MTKPNRFDVDKPVSLIDRFTVKPGCQQAAYDLMVREYADHVAPRGLRLVGAWLSPPFEQPGIVSELTVIWNYASLNGLWAARMAEEDDAVARRIWSDIAAMTENRSRVVARDAPMLLPPPDHDGELAVSAAGGVRTVLFIRPLDPLSETAAATWIAAAESVRGRQDGCLSSRAGFHSEYSFLPGHLTWDVTSSERIDPAVFLAALPGPAELVESVELGAVIAAGLRKPGQGGIKRTILVRTRAGIGASECAAFEHAMAETPFYVTSLDNWRLSRVAASHGPVGWTHCYEQEVADAGVFVGDYLNHPYHWSVIERLFHPDAPERIGDAFLHTLYPIDRSVLSEIA
ncbi:MAG: NIPSNAP family protein [Janthinobacterium lividum]